MGLLLAALMALVLIWLINRGALQAMDWLTKGLLSDPPNEQQSNVRIVLGVLVALVLPLAAYRLRRGRGKAER